MCNLYSLKTGDLFETWNKILRLPIVWDGQASNLQPVSEIKITDTAPVLRAPAGEARVAMTRWAWKGFKGKPVFNFVSEGRDFTNSDRVLIPADAFYEFTDAEPGQKLKTKWRFTMNDAPLFWIAGIVKEGCFTMLTTSPGPDIAPYHDRQVVLLRPEDGLDWLNLTKPQPEILAPAPAGTLVVERITKTGSLL